MVDERQTKEKQYAELLEVQDRVGIASLGIMTNQVWYDDPRRLTFLLSRYKFVSKMLSGKIKVAEIGCGDAFGSRVVQQEVKELHVYDFDPIFIDDIEARQVDRWKLHAHLHDILSGPLNEGPFDAIYSVDVMEHIAPDQEKRFIDHLKKSLAEHGVLIVGMPSLESQTYASTQSKIGHVNCKTGTALKATMERHFENVFLFSMNDEVVHTGFSPMGALPVRGMLRTEVLRDRHGSAFAEGLAPSECCMTAVRPPSTTRVCPVMWAERSLHRKSIAYATSRGLPICPSGITDS